MCSLGLLCPVDELKVLVEVEHCVCRSLPALPWQRWVGSVEDWGGADGVHFFRFSDLFLSCLCTHLVALPPRCAVLPLPPSLRYGYLSNTKTKVVIVLRDVVVREDKVKEVRAPRPHSDPQYPHPDPFTSPCPIRRLASIALAAAVQRTLPLSAHR